MNRPTPYVEGPLARRRGGDSKVVAEIAARCFGGFPKMFEHHGWPERGSAMMPKVQARVAEIYGSVRAFEDRFAPRKP